MLQYFFNVPILCASLFELYGCKILLLKKQGHFVIWEQYDLVKQSILDMLSAINKEKAEL